MFSTVRTITSYRNFSVIEIPYFNHINLWNRFLHILSVLPHSLPYVWVSHTTWVVATGEEAQQTSSWTSLQAEHLHGPAWGLSQGAEEGPAVQEQILGRLRAFANIQGICDCVGARSVWKKCASACICLLVNIKLDKLASRRPACWVSGPRSSHVY